MISILDYIYVLFLLVKYFAILGIYYKINVIKRNKYNKIVDTTPTMMYPK